MKLFTRYTRINLLSTIIIFLLGSVAFGFLLHFILIKQIDEDLRIEENEIETSIAKYHHLPLIVQSGDQYTSFKIVHMPASAGRKIYTKSIEGAEKDKNKTQRVIEFNVYADNNWYTVTVSKSLDATNHLVQTITIITLSIILLILAATFFINRFMLRRLWKPFYTALYAVQQFNLRDSEKLTLQSSGIDEFNYLNSTLSEALNKAKQDYQALKEFTENASHELQTPLAVIQSKLDILIQSENLAENESHAIQSAYNAVQNLSKLNKALLLLTKIENRQFHENSEIEVREFLQNKIDQFNEIWKSRNIDVQIELSDKKITGNTYLVDVLLNNLLSNATKHNVANGSVSIVLRGSLCITNTGVHHALDEKHLYKRFSKLTKAANNQGLGLSIIQQICVTSAYKCVYKFTAPNLHSFTVSWE